jgi:hypothetical protein
LNCNFTNKLQGLYYAAAYLATVATMGKKEQYALYKELINGRRRVAHGYNLRIGDDMAIWYSLFLCRNSFLNILGVGKTRYTNWQATRFTRGMNTHKNSGNSHAAMTAGTNQNVIDFINQKGKEEGEVYVTYIIRSLAGYELREEEKRVIDLPSNKSRREMYEKYCFERGWWSCPKPSEALLTQVKDETAAKRKVKAAAAKPEKDVAAEDAAPQAKAAPKAKAEATKRKAAGQGVARQTA